MSRSCERGVSPAHLDGPLPPTPKRGRYGHSLHVEAVAEGHPGRVPKPPNIVLIIAEDLSPRVGAFGDRVAQTPNIDALARLGIKYTQVFRLLGFALLIAPH